MRLTIQKLIKSLYVEPISITGGKTVVAAQIYHGRFRFASKNCENNNNTGFATLFLVLKREK
jgi:hypothetical protein